MSEMVKKERHRQTMMKSLVNGGIAEGCARMEEMDAICR
jgi:hypothetical protein